MATHKAFSFLGGGGEMGKRIQEKNWAATVVGNKENWPQSLKTTLSILLHSRLPMFLFWGDQMTCFYNDAYCAILGRNPGLLGLAAEKAWPGNWHIIQPEIAHIRSGGEPGWNEDRPLPLYGNNGTAETWASGCYSAVKGESGSIAGVLVIASEISGRLMAESAPWESEKQFSHMVMQSPIAMTIMRGPDLIIEMANEVLLNQLWRKQRHEVMGRRLLDVFPELQSQKYPVLLKKVMDEGIVHREQGAIAYVQRNEGMQKFYLDYEYAPLYERNGLVSRVMVTVNDVTRQVEARQKLEDAEARLRLAAEGTGMATWDLNLQTQKIIYTLQLAVIFGRPETALLTHADMRNIIHPDDLRDIVKPAFSRALETGTYSYEARIVHPDSSIHWIRVQGKVIFDEQNKPYRILGTLQDVSEEKINEEMVQRLAAIVQSSDDAIISKKMDGTITSWNDAAKRMFKYEAEEIIGKPITILIPDDKQDEESRIIERLNAGERIDHFETKRITKDRKLLDISLTVSPLRNSAGKIIGASKIIRDITRQKETDRLINESEQKFRLLADSMAQLIWTSDPSGQLNYFNKTVYDYTGLSFEELKQGGWNQVIHLEDQQSNTDQWKHVLETGTSFLLEHRFRRHDGEYRWQLSRAMPHKDENGRIQMWVGTSTDIDEIKKHDQQKDDFIKMASHELKTPVTTIKGYVQLLLKMNHGKADGFQLNILDTIDKQVQKLTKLITDLLDVTKIETGSLNLNKENFRIADMVAEIAADLETTSQTHQIRVVRNADPVVFADKDRIAQVLINLLANAIKYSPEAKEIITEIKMDDTNAIISVKDFGIGISPEDLPRIFERFYRAAGKDEKTFPGFGIGLFIVNEIISLHGGYIRVESEKSKGSVFYVLLPVIN